MGKFDDMAQTALELITEFGASVTLTRAVDAIFDPVTQDRVAAAPVTGTFKAVEIPPGKSAEFRLGSLVKRNVIQLYLARWGVAMEPAPGDTLLWKGATYTILSPVTHYDPAADGAILTVAYAER